jgi:hypothetical protein
MEKEIQNPGGLVGLHALNGVPSHQESCGLHVCLPSSAAVDEGDLSTA